MSLDKDYALFRSMLTKLLAPDKSEAGRNKYVLVDNYRIHCATPVQTFLAEHQDEFELISLPTYFSKLNPVERFWKHLGIRSLLPISSRPWNDSWMLLPPFFVTWPILWISFARSRG
jgi:transposase